VAREGNVQREKEWLTSEVHAAASLTDRDRIRILRDLLRTRDAIRAAKTPEQLLREEEVLRKLEREPGLARYAALVERFEGLKLDSSTNR
jgi:hypothetical protein